MSGSQSVYDDNMDFDGSEDSEDPIALWQFRNDSENLKVRFPSAMVNSRAKERDAGHPIFQPASIASRCTKMSARGRGRGRGIRVRKNLQLCHVGGRGAQPQPRGNQNSHYSSSSQKIVEFRRNADNINPIFDEDPFGLGALRPGYPRNTDCLSAIEYERPRGRGSNSTTLAEEIVNLSIVEESLAIKMTRYYAACDLTDDDV